jgi:hypothetical protein
MTRVLVYQLRTTILFSRNLALVILTNPDREDSKKSMGRNKRYPLACQQEATSLEGPGRKAKIAKSEEGADAETSDPPAQDVKEEK